MQLKLDKQNATLDEVQSDIDGRKDKLEKLKREKARFHTRCRAGRKAMDKAVSAQAITSTILTLVVSSTIVVSIPDIATQAAHLSRLSEGSVKIGKRPSSVLFRASFGGAHSDMGLNGTRIMDVLTASEQKIHLSSHSPKRERQSQDVTVSAEEDLELFEKAWSNQDRLSKGRSVPMDSNGH